MQALIDHFKRMAAYNTAANRALYAAVALLPEAAFVAERPAFFGSIRGVLNHIVVGDRIWLARFEGGTSPSTDLDALLYDSFADLEAARVAEDARIERIAAGLTPEFLQGDIRYVNNQGRDMVDPNATLVAHFFNHQTHHRARRTAC